MPYKDTAQVNRSILVVFDNNRIAEFTISDIAKMVHVDRDTASKHLAVIEAENKIEHRTIGTTKLFRFKIQNKPEIEAKINQLFSSIRKFELVLPEEATIERYKMFVPKLKEIIGPGATNEDVELLFSTMILKASEKYNLQAHAIITEGFKEVLRVAFADKGKK